MFDMESQPSLRRVSRLWRIGRQLYIVCTHTPIVEELELESVIESVDYGYEPANSNADPTKIHVWVRALRLIAK